MVLFRSKKLPFVACCLCFSKSICEGFWEVKWLVCLCLWHSSKEVNQMLHRQRFASMIELQQAKTGFGDNGKKPFYVGLTLQCGSFHCKKSSPPHPAVEQACDSIEKNIWRAIMLFNQQSQNTFFLAYHPKELFLEAAPVLKSACLNLPCTVTCVVLNEVEQSTAGPSWIVALGCVCLDCQRLGSWAARSEQSAFG